MGEERVSVPAAYVRKKQYTAGVVTMTERTFMFTPNDSRFLSTHKIVANIGNIKVQYGKDKGKMIMGITIPDSTNKGKCIFELDNFVDGDTCRAHTNKYVGKEPQGTAVSAVSIKVEIGRKIKLLQQNEEQRRLHEQLVIGNIINEDEFWVKRKKLLQAVAWEPTDQQTGLKSAMISYIQQMSGDQTKKVQTNSEIINQIFTEKPVVLREFLMKVPDQMKETEFWNKFLTAERYRQKENIALGRAEASADKQLAIFLEDDDIVADEVQHKIANVNPTIDMVADYSDDYTHLQGHGILRYRNDDSVPVFTDKLQHALLHDINRHAIIVLEGRAIDSKLHNAAEIAKALDEIQKAKKNIQMVDERIEKHRLQQVNKMVEIDDLQIPRNLNVPLYVKGRCQYSNSQEANAVDVHGGNVDVNLENVHADLKERSLKIKKKGLDNPILKPNLTLEHLAIILELLWHFWASYPATNEVNDNKVKQLKEAIKQRYKKLQEITKSLQSDVGRELDLLVQPMLQAIAGSTHDWQ